MNQPLPFDMMDDAAIYDSPTPEPAEHVWFWIGAGVSGAFLLIFGIVPAIRLIF